MGSSSVRVKKGGSTDGAVVVVITKDSQPCKVVKCNVSTPASAGSQVVALRLV